MVILVTRPEPGATRTAKHLRTLKFSPFILPLSKTIALPVSPQDFSCDGVIATSEAAFLYLDPKISEKLRLIPLYLVGKHTADVARKAGFNNIELVATDAKTLAGQIDGPATKSFLYLAGHLRHPDLELQMVKKFRYFRILEIYDTVPIKLDGQQKQQIPQKIEAIMLYSALAAAGLEQISGYINHSTVLLCLSARIANAVPRTLLNAPVIAYEPNEDAMLEGLKAVLF